MNSGLKCCLNAVITRSLVACLFKGCVDRAQVLLPNVASHDEDSVGKVHSATLAIRQTTIIHDLEEDIQDFSMCLFNLIQQHNIVGTTSHCLRQLSALLISYITWGAPINLLTACLSMYSLISILTMCLSSSKSSREMALASSVLPTPVGPRKRKEPMG